MAAAGRVTGDLVGTPKGSAQAAPQDTREESMQATIAPYQGPPLRQGKVALNFRLDPELHQQLRIASHKTDVSIQMIVETAVRRYLATIVL
jgi:predicted HicB family RNase H-like nuclease